MSRQALLQFTKSGIYCPQADVYIDPWKRVDKALITHAHADHARWGMKKYLAHKDSIPVMRLRLGQNIHVQAVEFGEKIYMNGVEISFHPAGHIIGSAQIRLAYQGDIWVVSGDYKVEDDGISGAFEPIPCHHFITESTFGLPVYRWRPQTEVMDEINQWWASNAREGKASLISAYSLGKAQRISEHLDRQTGPVFTHTAVENTNTVLRQQGIPLKPTTAIGKKGEDDFTRTDFRNALIIAPPGAIDSQWSKRLQPFSLGIASGWMNLRGARRRRAADRGFVLSDHADWAGLLWAVKETGAEQVFVTHGYADIFARYLQEQGLDGQVVRTEFGDGDDVQDQKE